ncbi:hypothetical protein GGR55DRAFT_599098 [Xylaria sp. FL0064]|nr:hypothetical protein GGR55DRAFT_599098 [Xylaria sp. FL0064]
MTTADPLVYYPQYCFHLSHTINTWCPLRAIDIAGLGSRPGFEDSNVFFYLNHPIQWVRIVGVVVAIDHYYGHEVYTIDDSTGQCIECTLPVPNPKSDKMNNRHINQAGTAENSSKAANLANTVEAITADNVPAPLIPKDIDIGTVLDVKGSVKLFRGQRQIKIQKAKRVLSTTQEALFWDKTRDFRRDTLSQPWILKDKEVRRCRRMQQAEEHEHREKRAKKKAGVHAERPGEGRGSCAGRIGAGEGSVWPKKSVGGNSAKASKAQRSAKVESLKSRIDVGDQYNALGL